MQHLNQSTTLLVFLCTLSDRDRLSLKADNILQWPLSRICPRPCLLIHLRPLDTNYFPCSWKYIMHWNRGIRKRKVNYSKVRKQWHLEHHFTGQLLSGTDVFCSLQFCSQPVLYWLVSLSSTVFLKAGCVTLDPTLTASCFPCVCGTVSSTCCLLSRLPSSQL